MSLTDIYVNKETMEDIKKWSVDESLPTFNDLKVFLENAPKEKTYRLYKDKNDVIWLSYVHPEPSGGVWIRGFQL